MFAIPCSLGRLELSLKMQMLFLYIKTGKIIQFMLIKPLQDNSKI